MVIMLGLLLIFGQPQSTYDELLDQRIRFDAELAQMASKTGTVDIPFRLHCQITRITHFSHQLELNTKGVRKTLFDAGMSQQDWHVVQALIGLNERIEKTKTNILLSDVDFKSLLEGIKLRRTVSTEEAQLYKNFVENANNQASAAEIAQIIDQISPLGQKQFWEAVAVITTSIQGVYHKDNVNDWKEGILRVAEGF